MGSSQSSPAVSENPVKGSKFSGGRGRKTTRSISTPGLTHASYGSLPSESLKSLKETDETHNTFDEILEEDCVSTDDEDYDFSDSDDESEGR